MTSENVWSDENLICILKAGGIAVMPTDTLYGIVGRAENRAAVDRIYAARKRNPEKPCIILIGDIAELEKFSIVLSDKQALARTVLASGNKEPVSMVLDCPDERFTYLHRGTKTLAFRVPAQEGLRNLLKQTGPLLAPSANLEARPPSENIAEAKKYFGDLVDPVRSRPREASATVTLGRPASNGVDMYIDGGEIKGKASKVIRLLKDGSVHILRE